MANTFGTVTLLLNKGGTGYKTETLRAGNGAESLVLANLNGGSRQILADVNMNDSDVGVFASATPAAPFTPNEILSLAEANGPDGVAAGNFTGHNNGALDLATVNRFTNDVTLVTEKRCP